MEEHEQNSKEPMLMTSPGRMLRGIIICAVTLAIGAAVVVTFFDEFFSVPPPVTRIQTPSPPPPPPPTTGVTTISILAGAVNQGAPDYDPDSAQVPLGNKVVWNNLDTAIHTATSGKNAEDPEMGARFDTSLVNGGESSKEIEIKDAKVGDVIPYFCFIHPYMTSELTITEAEEGGAPTNSSPIEALLTIPSGASIQGNPSYAPAELTVQKGKTILVVNEDNNIHTVTSGTPEDQPNAGKSFDTDLMNPGDRIEIQTVNLSPQTYDYFCIIHPYMKGKITVTE